MTGQQLKQYRKDHDLTGRAVASDLLGGEVHYSTITDWEKKPDKEIPKWASDKILGKTQITLPLEELHQLLDAARDENVPAQAIIAQALQEWLLKRRTEKQDSAPPPEDTSIETTERETEIGGHKVKIIGPTKYTQPPEQQNRAAEDPPTA